MQKYNFPGYVLDVVYFILYGLVVVTWLHLFHAWYEAAAWFALATVFGHRARWKHDGWL